MVLSLLTWKVSISTARMEKCSSSRPRTGLDKLLISSNETALNFHNHSQTCLARYGFSPFDSKKEISSSRERARISGRDKFIADQIDNNVFHASATCPLSSNFFACM